MDEYKSLSHTAWDCKYHVVFIPKCRRKTLYGHMMISIPPKYAVSQVVGYIKGKSAIHPLSNRSFRRRQTSGHGARCQLFRWSSARLP